MVRTTDGHFSIPVKKKRKTLKFIPKVSAKLPRPDSDSDELSLISDNSDSDCSDGSSEDEYNTEDETSHPSPIIRSLLRKQKRDRVTVEVLPTNADKTEEKKRKAAKAEKQKVKRLKKTSL